jgi:hypothetical protein
MGAIERFRGRTLGRTAAVLRPRSRDWRTVGPGFDTALELARAGVPFQIATERRYDRSGDPRRLARALGEGSTIFCPQIHQVLPRLARLMVALRVAFLGPAREECPFLSAVEGQGREGLGLHHDGEVDAFWLQLEGRRAVTIGPPVGPHTPLDLPQRLATPDGPGWRTIDLAPGTLFHLPARTPHRVLCHGRSLAISLTWARARGRPATLTTWDVVAGRADEIPRPDRARLWVQVPVWPRPGHVRRDALALWTAEGEPVVMPTRLRAWAMGLALMPWLRRRAVPAAALDPLLQRGILAPYDLPRVVRPDRPDALDGWRFR